MDIFPATGLPGVGMGSALSLVGLGGLVALATTSGAMLAQGILGTFVYAAAAVSVLHQKDEQWGGRPEFALTALAFLLVFALARTAIAQRAPAPDAAGVPASPRERSRAIVLLEAVSVALGGAVTGFAWAEWNEAPFALGDAESIAGTLIGLACAAVGAAAAHLFLSGSVRAGGDAVIVGAVVVAAAFTLNAAGFYIPFVGYLSLVLAAAFWIRLRRRGQKKYKGLRILSS